MPNVFRKICVVRIPFVFKRFDMIPMSLLKCVCCHANVVFVFGMDTVALYTMFLVNLWFPNGHEALVLQW